MIAQTIISLKKVIAGEKFHGISCRDRPAIAPTPHLRRSTVKTNRKVPLTGFPGRAADAEKGDTVKHFPGKASEDVKLS